MGQAGRRPPAPAPPPKVRLAFVAKVLSAEPRKWNDVRYELEVLRTLTGISRDGERLSAFLAKGALEPGGRYIFYSQQDRLGFSPMPHDFRKPEPAGDERVAEVAREFAGSSPTAGPVAWILVDNRTLRVEADGAFELDGYRTQTVGKVPPGQVAPLVEKIGKITGVPRPPDGKPGFYIRARWLSPDRKPLFAFKWVDKKVSDAFLAEVMALAQNHGKPATKFLPHQEQVLLQAEQVLHCQAMGGLVQDSLAKVRIIETLKGPDRSGETSVLRFDGGTPAWKDGATYVVCIVRSPFSPGDVVPLRGIFEGAACAEGARALFRREGLSDAAKPRVYAECLSGQGMRMLEFAAYDDGSFKLRSQCEGTCPGHEASGKLEPTTMQEIARTMALAESTTAQRSGAAYFVWHDAAGKKQSKRLWNSEAAPCPALIQKITAAALSAIELPQPAARPADATTVAGLVAELGGDKWQTRKAATDKLKALGRGAAAALREAARKPGLDPQIATGIAEVLQDLQDRLGDRRVLHYNYTVSLSDDRKSVICTMDERRLWSSSLGGKTAAGLHGHGPYVVVLPMRWVYRIADGTLLAKGR